MYVIFRPLNILLILLLLSSQTYAKELSTTEDDVFFKGLYHSQSNKPTRDMTARLNFFSQTFLNKPYLLGALGEGQGARFDESPLYRANAFDCETYVDTVLALALAHDFPNFKQCINQIRYKDGQVDFINRNHFGGLDWIQNNQQQGFIKDITEEITDAHHQGLSQIAIATIDKPSWYQHLGMQRIQISSQNVKEQNARLDELHHIGQKLPVGTEKVPYLSFKTLFDKHGKAKKAVFAQIPDGAIVYIVRANWNLKKEIGTNLNISHLGFVFWSEGKLLFRNASSLEGKVVEVPLDAYLLKARETTPTVTGIHIEVVVPKVVLASGCVK